MQAFLWFSSRTVLHSLRTGEESKHNTVNSTWPKEFISNPSTILTLLNTEILAKCYISLHILLVPDFWTESQLAEQQCISGYCSWRHLQKRLGPNMQAMQLPLPPTKLTKHSTYPASTCPGFSSSLPAWHLKSWQDTEQAKWSISHVKSWAFLFHLHVALTRKPMPPSGRGKHRKACKKLFTALYLTDLLEKNTFFTWGSFPPTRKIWINEDLF